MVLTGHRLPASEEAHIVQLSTPLSEAILDGSHLMLTCKTLSPLPQVCTCGATTMSPANTAILTMFLYCVMKPDSRIS